MSIRKYYPTPNLAPHRSFSGQGYRSENVLAKTGPAFARDRCGPFLLDPCVLKRGSRVFPQHSCFHHLAIACFVAYFCLRDCLLRRTVGPERCAYIVSGVNATLPLVGRAGCLHWQLTYFRWSLIVRIALSSFAHGCFERRTTADRRCKCGCVDAANVAARVPVMQWKKTLILRLCQMCQRHEAFSSVIDGPRQKCRHLRVFQQCFSPLESAGVDAGLVFKISPSHLVNASRTVTGIHRMSNTLLLRSTSSQHRKCLLEVLNCLKFLPQVSLGAEGVSLEFRHICTYLLWYCVQNERTKLLHEVILAVGHFTLGNRQNQVRMSTCPCALLSMWFPCDSVLSLWFSFCCSMQRVVSICGLASNSRWATCTGQRQNYNYNCWLIVRSTQRCCFPPARSGSYGCNVNQPVWFGTLIGGLAIRENRATVSDACCTAGNLLASVACLCMVLFGNGRIANATRKCPTIKFLDASSRHLVSLEAACRCIPCSSDPCLTDFTRALLCGVLCSRCVFVMHVTQRPLSGVAVKFLARPAACLDV